MTYFLDDDKKKDSDSLADFFTEGMEIGKKNAEEKKDKKEEKKSDTEGKSTSQMIDEDKSF